MTLRTLRTTTHSYPQEEIDAIMLFYRDKRCVVTNIDSAVNWCHILDAASGSSNRSLSAMLSRNLREDRHPRQTAEVRENIVPVNSSHHIYMDEHPPLSTLFLHEDVLARTLAYEQDLQAWRIAELEAGRADPGRPAYDEVFGGMPVTQHRYHCAGTFPPFFREEGDDYISYYSKDCPGIDDPTSRNHFPIINTLLSIPFSLIHNFPRLVAITPHNTHQHELIRMSSEILRLWWWDPPPEMIKRSGELRNQILSADRHNNTPSAKPHPIQHRSRKSTTFSAKQPILTFGDHNQCVLDLGPVFFYIPTHPDWLMDEMLPTDGDEGLTKEDLERVDDSIMAGVIGSPLTSEVNTATEDSDDTSDSVAIRVEPTICLSSLDIESWSQKVVNSAPEPVLTSALTPFERGIIPSMSVNDILMVKGLINPPVYLQFFDLSLFSCL